MNVVNVGYRSTNYYALDIQGGKLLVDCGWPATLPQFIAELKRKSIAPGEIKYIVATHYHPDHAGLVEEFKQLGSQLILMETQTRVLQSPAEQFAADASGHMHVRPENNILLKFSESRQFLAGLGLAGEIIPTPGHSDDSVTLILDEGFAFTGDLPPRFLVREEDSVTKASWDRIYEHPITRIFPAHGDA